ncbi:MAG TPA: hypothetical protein VE222_05715 [Nitrospiraceae bacterium]|nr:hypothetical protein [Nitrospiraceae bacterium]
MSKATGKTREQARELFLTNQMTTNAEIAARLKLKPHTVGVWRKQEDWDGLKVKIDRQAAEGMVKRVASDRITLNVKHYNYYEIVLGEIRTVLKNMKGSMTMGDLTDLVTVIEKSQKGQRLAKGLSMSGETEEVIRAEAQAELRNAINLVRDAIKENVTDEETRDRIGRAILAALPQEPGTGADESEDSITH